MAKQLMDVFRDQTSGNQKPGAETEESTNLRELLLAPDRSHLQLPRVTELTGAATALARGLRRKALLPLDDAPTEYALVRRGADVLVSVYDTGSAPEVYQLDHAVPLAHLLNACAAATLNDARRAVDPTAQQIAVRVAERALRTELTHDPDAARAWVTRRGGASQPREDEALAFGFELSVCPSPATESRAHRADVHALLFPGKLWGFVRGRRIHLGQGPIMLVVQRMVVAVRALVEAWEIGRTAHVRLRSGPFAIVVRLDQRDEVSFGMKSDHGELGAAALDVPGVALPVLRLASDLLRTLISVDRAQARNLRVTALRDEVRDLRRSIRNLSCDDGMVNADPDRVEIPSEPAPASTHETPSGNLRFDERWRIVLDDVDAHGTYFCGDRLVLTTGAHTLAVHRDDGHVLWAREGARNTLMAGRSLLRLAHDGDVEICAVDDGEPLAIARTAPRLGGPPAELISSGDGLPPTAILAEGHDRLIALDLRTGEPRWRFNLSRGGAPSLARAGRLLLVADEANVHAIDMISGEDVWRFHARARFDVPPTVVDDRVIVVSGRDAYGIDLLTGEQVWRSRFDATCFGPLLPTRRSLVLIPLDRDGLVAVDVRKGREVWSTSDPGLGAGGSPIVVDGDLIVNVPGGCVTALDLDTGSTRWTRLLGDPLSDEVPRQLEPILRGGALFVPAARVHVLRPSDGSVLGEVQCELIPDRIRVDERGWVYIAEESGHVAAYAPAPTLRLIRGGG